MTDKTVKKTPAKKAPAKKTTTKKVAAKKSAPKPLIENKEFMEAYGDSATSAAAIIESGPAKYLLYMKRGSSYTTASGVTFTKTHPFQLVDFGEMQALLSMPEDRFKEATPDEAKEYYQN
jgi:hypothetical protein